MRRSKGDFVINPWEELRFWTGAMAENAALLKIYLAGGSKEQAEEFFYVFGELTKLIEKSKGRRLAAAAGDFCEVACDYAAFLRLMFKECLEKRLVLNLAVLENLLIEAEAAHLAAERYAENGGARRVTIREIALWLEKLWSDAAVLSWLVLPCEKRLAALMAECELAWRDILFEGNRKAAFVLRFGGDKEAFRAFLELVEGELENLGGACSLACDMAKRGSALGQAAEFIEHSLNGQGYFAVLCAAARSGLGEEKESAAMDLPLAFVGDMTEGEGAEMEVKQPMAKQADAKEREETAKEDSPPEKKEDAAGSRSDIEPVVAVLPLEELNARQAAGLSPVEKLAARKSLKKGGIRALGRR